MSRRKEPSIPDDILDQLLAGTDAAAALSQGGLLDTLKKAFAERALNAEMDHHLGQEEQGTNSRNGYGRKTVTTDGGRIEIEVRVIGPAVLIRSLSQNISAVSPASMTRSSRCTRAA
jgi:hypothetical protein